MCALHIEEANSPTIKEFLLNTFPDEPRNIMISIARSIKEKFHIESVTEISSKEMLIHICSPDTNEHFDMGRVGRVHEALYKFLGFQPSED